ncbi:MAG: DUF2252 family protein, partial [Candidatus Nanopelagicales bacterium]
FDETLPGPFDWDVKRLSASAAVAARAKGASDKKARRTAKAVAGAYRTTIEYLSRMRTLDVWNVKLDVDYLLDNLGDTNLGTVTAKAQASSRRSTGDTALVKLTETVDGRRRFRTQRPLLVRTPDDIRPAVLDGLTEVYASYLRTLSPDRVGLLAHYSFVDLAHKVVGVGSVGTLALVMLMESGDGEPLLLQVKQANASVLERHLGASAFTNSGKRVVVGQRVMQATGDPFLGWAHSAMDPAMDFYIRQLRDLKGSIDVALLDADGLVDYAKVCGGVLARAHARVGDSSMVAGYLGDTEEFDDAIGEFALRYADITAADHAALVASRAG